MLFVKSKPKEYVKILKWNDQNNETFIIDVSDKLPELDSITSKILSAETDSDNGIKAFGELLCDTAYCVYGKCKQINSGLSRIYRSSPWFIHECAIARQQLKSANRLFRVCRTIVMYFLRNVEFFVE